jgi:hypothetical protein
VDGFRRARRRQPRAPFPAPRSVAQPPAEAAPASAHRFGDVAVSGERGERVLERGPLSLRFGIAGRTPVADTPATELPIERGELPLWHVNPTLDLLEVRHGIAQRVVAVKAVDLSLEPYRTATGLERGFAGLIDQIGALLQFDPVKHVLHLELSGEPTKDQLEGLARLRDYAQRRKRETGIDLEVHVAAPAGQPSLRPPTSS